MNNDCDLLYITFVDLNNLDCSGSSLRPLKMLHAFESLGLNIKVLDGWNNQRKVRNKNVKEILYWLKTNKPKTCYVEPPSGPIFCAIDLKLLRTLKKMGVPIGLFYRDAYWKFPSFDCGEKKPLAERIKLQIVKAMQMIDWRVFKKVCSHIFFPSNTMADLFDVDNKSALPPACVLRDGIDNKTEQERIKTAQYLTYFYVGGASTRYGTPLLIESFKKVNSEKVVSKLILVCPNNQWENIKNIVDTTNCDSWLTVVHASGDDTLKPLYAQSDIAVIPLLRSVYNDFAVPIKMYEYVSFDKPIVATNCTEMKSFICKNQVGYVVEDNIESLSNKIIELNENRGTVIKVKNQCAKVAKENTWESRAQRVIEVLNKD